MFVQYDISDWKPLSTEQMGTKPKFWCLSPDGERYLFKESRSHAGEHWSEKIASEIAGWMGLPHAEIELATYRGKLGTISRHFLAERPGASLIHGNELLLEQDPTYPAGSPNFRTAQHTLNRIIGVLDQRDVRVPRDFPDCARIRNGADLFVGYLLLDALIGNTDRHHENWAVVRDIETRLLELAPTFDHASSLGRELTDQRRESKLTAESQRFAPNFPERSMSQTIVSYLLSNAGRSRIFGDESDTKPLRPLEVFKQSREFRKDAAEFWVQRLESSDWTAVDGILSQIPAELMSGAARQFCISMIQLNKTALLSRKFNYV